MDAQLAQGVCMNCFHDLHMGKCPGGLDPTPIGDVWAECPCEQGLDYETAGQREVVVQHAGWSGEPHPGRSF